MPRSSPAKQNEITSHLSEAEDYGIQTLFIVELTKFSMLKESIRKKHISTKSHLFNEISISELVAFRPSEAHLHQ